MTIRHLKVFITVCEAGGVTKAAELLRTAQPAVSQTIAELEKYYNVRLFDRVNQRLVLTETGRELLLKAKEAVAGFADFEDLATSFNERATVRIGASHTIGKTVIPRLLLEIGERYPSVKPFVTICKTGQIEEMILNGELDFGLVEGRISSPAVASKPFANDRLAVVCGKDYSAPDGISVGDLGSAPLLLRERGSASRDLVDDLLSKNGYAVKPLIESGSNSALIAACEAGLGIAVLPIGIAGGGIGAGTLKEIKTGFPALERTSFGIYHKNKKFTRIQKEIFDIAIKKPTDAP